MNRTKLSKNERKELHAIFQLDIEPKTLQQATKRVSYILDASYEKADLVKVVKSFVVTYQGTDVKKSLNYYYNLKIYLMVPWVSFIQTLYIWT